jgi:predicted DNA-binding transcriptional regulator AlpA
MGDTKQLPNVLTHKQTAAEMGIAAVTLSLWRRQGRGPAWIQMGGRAVRYRREDVDAWMLAHRVGGEAK